MSSSEANQYEQLQMFMPAGKLRQDVAPSDFDADVHLSGWDNKLEESKRVRRHHLEPHNDGKKIVGHKSLHESIEEEGVVQPVEIVNRYGKDRVYEGHHRIAASADIAPTMEVPVIHRGWGHGPTSDQWWRIRE